MGRWRSRPGWGSLVALVLLVPALAAGCSIRALPEPPPTPAAPATTVATVRGTTVATRAFLLDWDAPGSPVRPPSHTGSELVNLVLVFPLLRSPPRCVRKVELRLWVLRLDHPRAALAAYPSLLVSLVSDRPTTRVSDETLVDNRPRGTGTLTADGSWMHFDLTGLYRSWASRTSTSASPASARTGASHPPALEGDAGLLSLAPVRPEDDPTSDPGADGASPFRW